LQTFVFENDEDVPLGWSITRPDRLRLDRALASDKVRGELERLVKFLKGDSP
jgi:hypothetical protein